MNFSDQNSKNSVPRVIPTVREVKEKSDNNKSKNTEKDFFKIYPTTKCYKCQGYGYIAANYPSPFKIAINDRVLIEVSKPDGIISLKVTLVTKKFIVTCPFSSSFLLPTPLSLSSLLSAPVVITCFGHHPFSLMAYIKY